MLDAEGGRTMYTDRGANLRLTASDLPLSLLDGVDVLHVNAYALFADGPRSAMIALIDEARRGGIAITVDPCSAAYLETLGASTFLDCTRGAAVCLPNLDEGRVHRLGRARRGHCGTAPALRRGGAEGRVGRGSGERGGPQARADTACCGVRH